MIERLIQAFMIEIALAMDMSFTPGIHLNHFFFFF